VPYILWYVRKLNSITTEVSCEAVLSNNFKSEEIFIKALGLFSSGKRLNAETTTDALPLRVVSYLWKGAWYTNEMP